MNNPVPIKPAATVAIVRDGSDGLETLLLRRNTKVKFAGGAWVFPGGGVEAGDFDAAADDEGACRLAAVRECHEEAGLALQLADLVPFAHWVTPDNMHKRFSTSFYIAAVTGDPEIIIDGSEIHEFAWMKPGEAAAAHRGGDLQLMPPTYITLLELAAQSTVAHLLAAYRRRGVRRFAPKVAYEGDKVCFLYEGDAGFEAHDPALEGERHRTLMDGNGCDYQTTLRLF